MLKPVVNLKFSGYEVINACVKRDMLRVCVIFSADLKATRVCNEMKPRVTLLASTHNLVTNGRIFTNLS